MNLFNRKKRPVAPYDSLEHEKKFAIYFLLEYLTMNGVPFNEQSWAFKYLEKAAKGLGITDRQIQDFRPFYSSYEKITEYIKSIRNRHILELIISSCSNLFILMDGGTKHKELGIQAYKLYEELGFSYDDVRKIVRENQYRSEF
ncbi:MAG: hypothetical protein K2H44_07255 [Muribaculaceae bacterium]|nr:hypothetical protein [Muribaculaceae bacterium]